MSIFIFFNQADVDVYFDLLFCPQMSSPAVCYLASLRSYLLRSAILYVPKEAKGESPSGELELTVSTDSILQNLGSFRCVPFISDPHPQAIL